MTETLAGAYATIRLAGRWLFRGPWSADITDHILVKSLEDSGNWQEWA